MYSMKITLTKKEHDFLFTLVDNNWYYIGDHGLENTKHGKMQETVFRKLVNTLNKTGSWYLWQLKDRTKGVTNDNIKDEWLKND